MMPAEEIAVTRGLDLCITVKSGQSLDSQGVLSCNTCSDMPRRGKCGDHHNLVATSSYGKQHRAGWRVE
jgi:hypothetical protein